MTTLVISLSLWLACSLYLAILSLHHEFKKQGLDGRAQHNQPASFIEPDFPVRLETEKTRRCKFLMRDKPSVAFQVRAVDLSILAEMNGVNSHQIPLNRLHIFNGKKLKKLLLLWWFRACCLEGANQLYILNADFIDHTRR